ncbi:hypothetical protein PAMP_018873 [Pampus punctatissimus]
MKRRGGLNTEQKAKEEKELIILAVRKRRNCLQVRLLVMRDGSQTQTGQTATTKTGVSSPTALRQSLNQPSRETKRLERNQAEKVGRRGQRKLTTPQCTPRQELSAHPLDFTT